MMRFKSLQSRIAFFFLGLLALVQSLVFYAVDALNNRQAHEQIEQALAAGAGNFRRMTDLRTTQLVESVRILSSDFAFKEAISSGDKATVHSVLANHGGRVGADVMILVSLDHSVLEDTRPMSGVYPLALGQLVQEAEKRQRASALIVLDGKPYQVAVLPVLAPEPIAWLVAGFALDDRLAQSMQQVLKLDISFYESGERVAVLASSLSPHARTMLVRADPQSLEKERVTSFVIDGSEVLSYATRMGTQGGTSIFVLLQRSMDEELKPFRETRNIVLLLSFGGLLLSLLAAFLIARSVTRPVRALVQAARGVERGDYNIALDVRQQDELGELATAFNRMVKGLVERDKARDLFGKFVPRAVAERALAGGEAILGGEERQVTVLFSDLRNFTSFSEHRPPQEIVSRLNRYFTRMSEVVERNHGMIDKFLGDGVMALFGAPAAGEDDAGYAMQAALDMCEALEKLNLEFAAQGLQRLDVGIGIHTGVMVAGNMGSPSRLNYTVIGDGVNLAARIEGLTKRKEYGTRIIVTEATMRASKRNFESRSLGLVAIRGRIDPVVLYALIEPGSGQGDSGLKVEEGVHPG